MSRTEPRTSKPPRVPPCAYLQVSRELAVLRDGLLVIGDGLLRRLHVFLRLSDLRGAQVQHLPQLQLRLSGVLLQLVVHLVYSFLDGGDNGARRLPRCFG